MKTKFILHGGFTPHEKQEDDAFFKEILKDVSEKAKVLLVYFASEIGRIPTYKEGDVAQFNKNKSERTLMFDVANERSFLKQVDWADIIYLHGGKTLKLLDVLKKFSNLKELFEGKTIAGDSAGANVLGKIFYSPSVNDIFEGLGLIPVKIIPHYSEKYKDKADELNKYNKDLELLLLREYQYKVFQK